MRAFRVASVAVLLAVAVSSAQAVVIDEFYYGTTSGNDEWIELYNRSSSAIDMTSWTIAVANNGPFQTIHTILTGSPDAVIPGNFYHLITDGAGTGLDFDENNINLNLARATGTVVYGIALVDDQGTTIDTVLYAPGGATNVYNLRDDDGLTSLSRVLGVALTQAYRRKPTGVPPPDDYQDTNDSSNDFVGTSDTGDPVPVEIDRFVLE